MSTDLILESAFLKMSKLLNPRIRTTGRPSSACPMIRDAAAANSSQVAISVVLEHGKSGKYSMQVAKDLLDAYFANKQ